MIKSDVVFDEKEHKYTLYDVPLISVTQILKKLDDAFVKVNPEILKRAGDKGTDIHNFCENYVLSGGTLELNAFEDDFPDYKQNFIKFWKQFQPKQMYTEIITHHDFEYAGMVDLVAKRDNQWYIIDYKTSSNVQQAYKWGIQMALYQRALEQMGVNLGVRIPVKRLVLHLTSDVHKLLDLTDNFYLYVADEIIASILRDTFDEDMEYLKSLVSSAKNLHKNKYATLTQDGLLV